MIHGNDLNELRKHISSEILPDEYLPEDYSGPSAGPMSQIVGEQLIHKYFWHSIYLMTNTSLFVKQNCFNLSRIQIKITKKQKIFQLKPKIFSSVINTNILYHKVNISSNSKLEFYYIRLFLYMVSSDEVALLFCFGVHQ